MCTCAAHVHRDDCPDAAAWDALMDRAQREHEAGAEALADRWERDILAVAEAVGVLRECCPGRDSHADNCRTTEALEERFDRLAEADRFETSR